jgi:hypothetical protein
MKLKETALRFAETIKKQTNDFEAISTTGIQPYIHQQL